MPPARPLELSPTAGFPASPCEGGCTGPPPQPGATAHSLTPDALTLAEAVIVTEPLVHFGFGLGAGIAVALLQAADQLVALAVDAIEVIIREVAPPFLKLATHLLPLSL